MLGVGRYWLLCLLSSSFVFRCTNPAPIVRPAARLRAIVSDRVLLGATPPDRTGS